MAKFGSTRQLEGLLGNHSTVEVQVLSPAPIYNNAGVAQLAAGNGFKLRSVWVRVPPPVPTPSGVMAAAIDSKSIVRKYVRVQVPPWRPTSTNGNVAQLAAGGTFRACSVWVRVPPFLPKTISISE